MTPGRQRRIQEHFTHADRQRPQGTDKQAMRAGARPYRAVRVLFAREGADVGDAYLSEHKASRLTKQKIEAEGRKCIPISGDGTHQKFCEKAAARTVKEFGWLDVPVNNAAFQVNTSRFKDLTVERGVRVHAVAPRLFWTPLNASERDAEDVIIGGYGGG